MQATPFAPQALMLEAVTQVPLLQHPEGHESASHTHEPLTQCWFRAHSAPTPHEQSPMFEQLSLRTESHAMQADPPKPHAPNVRGLHVGPEQQPVAHVMAQPLQVPFMHVSPLGQLWHADPPLPQAPSMLPGWQRSAASQQPVGQDVPSQTQVPFRQRWPAPHDVPLPHVHSPPTQASAAPEAHAMQPLPCAPQAESDGGVQVSWSSQQPSGHELALHSHWAFTHAWPGPQAAPAPQRHSPCGEHVSAATGSQAKHVAPAAPQAPVERTSHWLSLQHPSGHDVASQTQFPPSHRWPFWHGGPSPQDAPTLA
jgi:hypothetical protein